MLIVTAATEKEMHAAFGFAGGPDARLGQDAEITVGGRKLLLCVTGVGLVSAALAAGRLLERPGVEGLITVGIAGAYNINEFPLASTCFAWREIWPEYGLLDEDGGVDAKGIGFPQLEAAGGKPVWDTVSLNPTNDAARMGLTLGAGWARASAISVAGVTGTDERAGWLQAAYTADIENMEGFALALGAARAGVPFLELRTVSNLVGSRVAQDWDVKGALGALGKGVRTLLGA